MNIAIIALGSSGDVQPYIALAKGLKSKGYSVKILALPPFENIIRNEGVAYHPLYGFDVKQASKRVSGPERSLFYTPLNAFATIMTVGMCAPHKLDIAIFRDTDLIICSGLALALGLSIAEKLRIKGIVTSFQPGQITSEFPYFLVTTRNLGAVLNRFTYHLWKPIWFYMRATVNQWRQQTLGLPPIGWNPLQFLEAHEEVPHLCAVSQHIVPKPADWGYDFTMTGYWFFDPPSTWQPPIDLVKFLESGAAPVYIGFGSVVAHNPQATIALILEALEISGQRGVVASGWSGLQYANIPNHVHILKDIPHNWLFPKMTAVVHHGGAGTTAAGLRAGVPNILVPFTTDQPFWGARVARIGVGPQPIPWKKLTAHRLANAITQAVTDTEIRLRAEELGHKIRAEDGIGTAIRCITHFLQTGKASCPTYSHSSF